MIRVLIEEKIPVLVYNIIIPFHGNKKDLKMEFSKIN